MTVRASRRIGWMPLLQDVLLIRVRAAHAPRWEHRMPRACVQAPAADIPRGTQEWRAVCVAQPYAVPPPVVITRLIAAEAPRKERAVIPTETTVAHTTVITAVLPALLLHTLRAAHVRVAEVIPREAALHVRAAEVEVPAGEDKRGCFM